MQNVQGDNASTKAATLDGEKWAGDMIRLLLCRPPGGWGARHHQRGWRQTGRCWRVSRRAAPCCWRGQWSQGQARRADAGKVNLAAGTQ